MCIDPRAYCFSSQNSPQSSNPVSLLGHVEAARVNKSSIAHFIEGMVFILITSEKVIIRPIHAIKTSRKSYNLKQHAWEV